MYTLVYHFTELNNSPVMYTLPYDSSLRVGMHARPVFRWMSLVFLCIKRLLFTSVPETAFSFGNVFVMNAVNIYAAFYVEHEE
jgi:hypothetical protein